MNDCYVKGFEYWQMTSEWHNKASVFVMARSY